MEWQSALIFIVRIVVEAVSSMDNALKAILIFLWAIICSGVYKTQGVASGLSICLPASECTDYRTIDSTDRSADVLTSGTPRCDHALSDGWYRFVGAAGTRMPTTCIPRNHCGTRAPGWMNGSDPKVQDGVVSRAVCFHWADSCCHWSVDIKVRNCGLFVVYKLTPPPTCHLRYCGDRLHNHTNECRKYTPLDSSDRATSYQVSSGFKCDYNLPKAWYRFTGKTAMPTQCVPTNHCGTRAPGWLNGSLPTVAEGAVVRQACFHWSGDCCRWSTEIRVRNCGGFHVYELAPPPTCHLRYCALSSGGLSSKTLPTTATAPRTTVHSTPLFKVRLVGGKNAREGRVEVLHKGEWGTICDERWEMTSATVVCRMLGFPKALRAATFGRGSGKIWLDGVQCQGNEATLYDCKHRSLGPHNCRHGENAAGVVCQTSFQSVFTTQIMTRYPVDTEN